MTTEVKQSCEQTQYFNDVHYLIEINNYRAKGDTHIIVHECLEDDLCSECQPQLTVPGSKQLGCLK